MRGSFLSHAHTLLPLCVNQTYESFRFFSIIFERLTFQSLDDKLLQCMCASVHVHVIAQTRPTEHE